MIFLTTEILFEKVALVGKFLEVYAHFFTAITAVGYTGKFKGGRKFYELSSSFHISSRTSTTKLRFFPLQQ